MAHLWVRDDDDQWAALPLNGGPVSLSVVPPKPFGGGERPRPDREVLLMPAARSGQENWVLVSGDQRRTSVNGLPLALGLRILGDRDEIRVDGASTVFFSTESLARIEPYPGSAEPACCPRCRLDLKDGAPAVRCPQCRVWHHEDLADDLDCWSSEEHCALCPQATDLRAGFRWSPEDL